MHGLIDRLDLRAASIELVFIPAKYTPNGQVSPPNLRYNAALPECLNPKPQQVWDLNPKCSAPGMRHAQVGWGDLRPDVVGWREERVVVEVVDVALDYCPRHSDRPYVACSISSPRVRKYDAVFSIVLKRMNLHISWFRV